MTDAASELYRAVERLASTIDQLRNELVRKDVYESNERARDREFVDLRSDVENLDRAVKDDRRDLDKKIDVNEARRLTDRAADEEKAAANRRLIIASFVAPLLVALLLLYVAAQIGSAPA